VNLGAGTITSNLKNTYGDVQLWTPAGERDTGQQFLGTLFGDHAKTGIGMVLNTGTVIGAAANVYVQMNVPIEPPFFARTVHPASPPSITVHGENIDLDTTENPLLPLRQSDPATFQAHLDNGRRTYYRNCVYCHGDDMSGNGMFVHGLDPIPTNFTDPGTIAQLRDTFLFWRIAKGGPGLPDEGGPWASAMPAWETYLSEEEMWEVVLFLYEFTNQRPRAREVAH